MINSCCFVLSCCKDFNLSKVSILIKIKKKETSFAKMPVMYNTGDWFKLEPDTYRKIDLITPEWPHDLDLEHMQVTAAPFGGPIACMRNFKIPVPLTGSTKNIIRIFDTGGQEMGRIEWLHGKLITIGWSDSEELICVQDDARVFVYDMFGNKKEKDSYSIGKEASLTKIVDAKVFQSYTGTGVAVKTTSGRIFLKLNNAKDSRTRQLPEIPKSLESCKCWAIVSEERNSYCLLGSEREIIKLYPGESMGTIVRNLFDKPIDNIIMISVAYNHKSMALYSNTGVLWLGTVDMKKKFCEFDTGRTDRPLQIEWIMNIDNNEADAVVIAYPSLLLVVNRNGDKNLSTYDVAINLIPEMDGVRILTNTVHEYLQKLPVCVKNIFGIISQEPASYLFEAHKKYLEKCHKSDDYISSIRDRMDIAVDECIEAAAMEFCSETQKSLLRAAYFGKSFIPSHNPDEYMRILRILRVLNALRHPKIAIPITYKQFMHLKTDVILSRLVFRKHYAIAIQVAKHLKLPESWIFEHWAYHKITTDQNDYEVARKIREKFKNPSVEGVSFCKIAEQARNAGRDELAIKLLELEPRTSLHVPLLLKLGKYERAVQSATQSGDTELVTTVLLEIKNKMMLANFHMTIREYPMALNIYKHMMNEWGRRSALYDIYNTEDDHKAIAEYHFRNALESNTLEANLPIIANSYTQGRCNTEAELCSDTSKLLKLQKQLTTRYEKAYGHIAFHGMTVHDTVSKLLHIGELKEAEKLRNDFKIPEKRYWYMRIDALAEASKWDELEKLAKSKKSPIGYEPFLDECLKHNNLTEARKYILKCPEQNRTQMYMKAELFDEAVDSAFEQRDLNDLQSLQQRAMNNDNHNLLDKINNYIMILTTKK